MTTGSSERRGSARMAASTSRPFTLGRFRSSKTRSGRSAFSKGVCRRRKRSACSPSRTMKSGLQNLASLKACCVNSTSGRLSSTNRTLMAWSACAVLDTGVLLLWDGEEEGGTPAKLGGGPDLAAVALDDALADAQPDPGARVFVAVVQALEHLEDAAAVLGVEADALVGDLEPPPIGR